MLKEMAVSLSAKEAIGQLSPSLNPELCEIAIRETSDARALIEAQGLPPLAIMEGLEGSILLASQGGVLMPEELSGVSTFANTCRRMENYLKRGEVMRIELSLNGRAFLPLEDISLMIDESIRGDEVSDTASSLLKDLRRKIAASDEQIKAKLNNLLSGHREWFADGYVAIRGGRPTLPVKAQYKSMVKGTVIDRSQTGGTVFIEPASVRALQEEAQLLRLAEENEVRRILYELTGMVADSEDAIRTNMRLMERLDFAFAKGRLSLSMDARAIPINPGREMKIVRGRHPLLDPKIAVPLDFAIGEVKDGEAVRGVIITGPNTGGKTVALKTIGLHSLMAQSGLHVPAGEGSRLCMFNLILCDIGDGQSIAENLSTFSSHMTRVLSVLKSATRDSLVLLDELGSGTDPAEGMGLAVAILEALSSRGCLFVATTHYPEIKAFANEAPGMINARMAFDPETLSPLYRMEIGEAGESCALHIARRLGFPEAMLERARQAAYGAAHREAPTPAKVIAALAPAHGAPRFEHFDKPKVAPERAQLYQRGDCVRVYPEGQFGIVCATTDERGQILVQLRGSKRAVPYKRLKRIAPAEEMYPDDYDFSIVFDTVANRKARHTMSRKFDRDAVIREE